MTEIVSLSIKVEKGGFGGWTKGNEARYCGQLLNQRQTTG